MFFETRTLDNRLTVVHIPTTSPGYAIGVRIAAGSRHDPPAQRGLAHVLEHVLVYLPSADGQPLLYGSQDGKIAVKGGWTTHEETIYAVNAADDALARALGWLSRALYFPVFAEETLRSQLGVITSEADRQNPYRPSVPVHKRLDFESAFFGDAALADAVIGHESTRAAITLALLQTWHAEHYVGGRSTVVVAGPGASDVVIQAVTEAFARVTPGEQPPPLPPARDGHGIGRRIRRTGSEAGSRAYIQLGARTTGTADPDWPLLSLIAAMIAVRLDKTLRNDLGLTYHVHVSQHGGPDWGRLYLYTEAPPAGGKTLLREVNGLIEEVQRFGFAEVELQAALAKARTRVKSLTSSEALVNEVIRQIDGWAVHPEGPVEWNSTDVSLERVNQAVNRLLNPSRSAVVYADGNASNFNQPRVLIAMGVLMAVYNFREALFALAMVGWNQISIWISRLFGH